MGQLLYSARDRDGKPVEGFVEAASAAEARQRLVARGLVDVVLHQEANLGLDSREIAGLTPQQVQQLARMRIRAQTHPGILTVWGEVARMNALWLAVDVAMFAWGAWTGSVPLMACGGVLAVFPFAMSAWKYRHGDRYNELIKAWSIGDWARVRELATRLREVSSNVANLDFDLDVRLASIEARDGDLAGALAKMEPWRPKLAARPGLFEGRVASIHAAAGDRPGFIRMMAEAYERAANEPARALDLALAEARFGDAARAAELLAGVDASLLPPHAQAFLAWTDGLVRLRRNVPGALDRLGEGVASFLRLSGDQPAAWTSLAFCTCDHAVALALAGRKDEARRELAEVWPIVRAHGDKSLLRMLQADGLAPN